ncbi:hypothetical protein [Deinococcus sp.]|uniref:hypothetical protein n=1 Tax=Deinococcus sp. TaxID=47478 RepID=UPI0025BA1FF8|nr:hypothetical protein [Deinococcus sp.]
MLKSQILTALLALSVTARSGAPLTADTVTPWVEQHVSLLTRKAAALRDGATWTEVTDLIDATVRAAQDLKGAVAGVPRARIVRTVLQLLVREFAPPSAGWLLMLLDNALAEALIEMAFKRLFD